jgi:hypothetical protein
MVLCGNVFDDLKSLKLIGHCEVDLQRISILKNLAISQPIPYLDLWFMTICFSNVFQNFQDGGKSVLTDVMGPGGKFVQHEERHLRCLQKVFNPLDLFHILLCYSQNSKCIKYLFFPPIYTQYPIMTKWKHVFRNVCKCIDNEIQKYLIYISIHTPESINVRITFGSD